MSQSQYRKDLKEATSETGFTLRTIFGPVVMIIFFLAVIVAILFALGVFGEGAKVLQNEVGAKALNEKYNWFKDASSQIRAKHENIETLKKRNASFTKDLGDRSKWDRTDKETYAQFLQESTAAIQMYNNLVGEYNAEMVKWHTKFANAGSMPHDWEKVAPEGFPEYRSE